ncbi:oxidoreductase [Pseudoclavibacter endophyticus]|uniref:LLM class flavin-dependent oxidoreductase n=1 Tax=Pseudoclavibacter endophyticus TaxID=1778590 RepID=A0A6H9WPG7_9MICO|nr:LLM class flavin-dependent oxidoreductase [Pseudoclavibacter endophyticus]KAB1647795.1 LLM class flavin-dependent oxidoreductase [Pseudoclavibacter endophyticus]GGA72885.1 oxidoreductase [Pseudoclavibacter endophyticus]
MANASLGAVELGLDTFGDVTDGLDGEPLSQAQVIRNVVEQARLADRVGVDFIGIGEHHRDDFAVSSPETVLAAIATVTERIRLGTAVTVLSSDDPVRVFQRFATLDAVSNGRAEAIVGRGSFTESFGLFGLSLQDYDVLFAEKLDLFAKLVEADGPVSWSGSVRARLDEVTVYPRLEHRPLKTWVAVGGTPESVVRAAQYGMPLMLAIIGGGHERFAPFVRLYRQALEKFERPVDLPVGAHSPGHVAESDREARDQYYEGYIEMMARIGRERGWSRMTREHFEEEVEHGALFVGSTETVARRIAHAVRVLGLARFDLKYSAGTLPHEHSMRSIELYGTEVIPRVRELLNAEAVA